MAAFLLFLPIVVLADYLDVFIRAGWGAIVGLWQGDPEHVTDINIWASGPEYKELAAAFIYGIWYGEPPEIDEE